MVHTSDFFDRRFLGLRDEAVEKVPSVPAEFKRDIPKFGNGQAVVKALDVEAVEVVAPRQCGETRQLRWSHRVLPQSGRSDPKPLMSKCPTCRQ